MSWVYLFIAGFFEMFWAVGLRYTHGFSRLTPSVLTVIGMAASFLFLSLALKHLPIGIAYAVWTGLGIVGTFIASIFLFHESTTPLQFLCVACIVGGIAGLRLSAG